MKRPTEDQFNIAMMWLESNEGDGAEGEACKAVANYLAEKIAQDKLRRIARRAGLPVAKVRKKLKENRA